MYHIRPQWYFTTEAMENYMKIAAKKWNTHDVGTKVEAFAIAGCDTLSMCGPLGAWKTDSLILQILYRHLRRRQRI